MVGTKYRLIQYEDGSQEFYNMKKDPDEWTNLAGRKKYLSKIRRMQKAIPAHWAACSKYSVYPFNEYFRTKYPEK